MSLHKPTFFLLLAGLFLSLSPASARRGSFVQLPYGHYSFATDRPPVLLSHGDSVPFMRLKSPCDYRDEQGFTLVIPIKIADFIEEKPLFSIADILSLRLRQHDPSDIRRQNYPAGRMPDGRVPVLEATLRLQLPPDGAVKGDSLGQATMTIGVPLGLLKRPWGDHEVALHYTGVVWDMYVDGALVDRDYAFGCLPSDTFGSDISAAQLVQDSRLLLHDSSAFTGQLQFYAPSLNPQAQADAQPTLVEAQYFTPQGHNAWVGDVATICHEGRYHIFYLLDRRGHESKFGRGGHYFEHLSTTDFRHWTAHDAAVPLDEQWETIGTGTPFVWHDTLFLSYGMHTSRLFPAELTATPRQWRYIDQHGQSMALPFDSLHDAYPAGSSYSRSMDGVAAFRKSRMLIHPAENPNIFTTPDGQLGMLANYGARGQWASNGLDGGWHCVSEDCPPGGDCTFFFPWGDYEYIVGGFTHMWKRNLSDPSSAFTDMVAEGVDAYDGLSVPSLTEVDGRRLMAGWVGVNGHWGGALVVRELLQEPDGRLSSRFMPEMMPLTGRSSRLARCIQSGQSRNIPVKTPSFMLTFDVESTACGSLSVQFSPDEIGKNECFWSFDAARQRAQFSVDNTSQKTLREGGKPHQAGDYAVENLLGTAGKFKVRMIIKGEPKWGGSLIDVEIAGRRTMISHRSGLTTRNIRIDNEGMVIRNVRLAPLRDSR